MNKVYCYLWLKPKTKKKQKTLNKNLILPIKVLTGYGSLTLSVVRAHHTSTRQNGRRAQIILKNNNNKKSKKTRLIQ